MDRIEELTELADQLQSSPNSPELAKRLQKAVWKLQTVPLDSLVAQAHEISAEISARIRKRAVCEISGFDFEVSPALRDCLGAILLHAIRNALDHGLESVEERAVLRKSKEGSLSVVGSLERGRLHVQVADDGRGPDLRRITARAVALGLVTREHADELTEAQKLEFLFEPGFSTREHADEISGRGIGLDAVESISRELGGRAYACAGAGGSGFILSAELPLPLVAFDAVPITVADQVFWLKKGTFMKIENQGAHAAPRAGALQRLFGAPVQETQTLIRISTSDAFTPSTSATTSTPAPTSRDLFVDAVGAPEYRLFRHLDRIWRSTAKGWMKVWIEATEGHALACRVPSRAGMSLLADASLLQRLTD